MGITAGIGHFFESILEVFQGIFAAILHAFQFVLQTFVDLGKGAVNFIEGTLGFAVRKLCDLFCLLLYCLLSDYLSTSERSVVSLLPWHFPLVFPIHFTNKDNGG